MKKMTVNPIDLVLNLSKIPNIDDLFIEISDLKNNEDNNFITYLTKIYNKIMLIKKAIYSEFEESYNIDELVTLYFNNDIEQFNKTKSLVDNLLSSFYSFDIKDTNDKENKLSLFEKLIDLFDLDIQYIFQIIKARTNNFSKLVNIDNDKMLEYSKMIHILKEKYKLDWNDYPLFIITDYICNDRILREILSKNFYSTCYCCILFSFYIKFRYFFKFFNCF